MNWKVNYAVIMLFMYVLFLHSFNVLYLCTLYPDKKRQNLNIKITRVRNDIDVNEHERLYIIALGDKLYRPYKFDQIYNYTKYLIFR